jgi:hypothetical protein
VAPLAVIGRNAAAMWAGARIVYGRMPQVTLVLAALNDRGGEQADGGAGGTQSSPQPLTVGTVSQVAVGVSDGLAVSAGGSVVGWASMEA